MTNEDNWGKSVAGVVIKENKVLLARHTYGNGKGKLIIPGGYVKQNETPQDAVKREIYEETNVIVEPMDIIGIRFNLKDWYIIFSAKYIDGEIQSDHNENSEVVWLDLNEAVIRKDVPDLTKKLLIGVMNDNQSALKYISYEGNDKNGPYSLYGLK